MCVKAVHVMRISDYLVMLILCPCTGLSTPGRITKGSRTRSVTRAGASPSKRLAGRKTGEVTEAAASASAREARAGLLKIIIQ